MKLLKQTRINLASRQLHRYLLDGKNRLFDDIRKLAIRFGDNRSADENRRMTAWVSRVMKQSLELMLLSGALLFASDCMGDEPRMIELIGSGAFAGSATDLSGDSGTLEEGSPRNRLGGFSAIEYSGSNNRFMLLADRGPADGATGFECRWHVADLQLNLPSKSVVPQLVATQKLQSSDAKPLQGALSLLENPQTVQLAFDPEGFRKLASGDWVVTDEYGPTISLFNPQGKMKSRWALPDWMHLSQGVTASEWNRGTVPNRGLEGVAITPDGQLGLAVMQGALGQDAEISGKKRIGKFARIVAFDPSQPGPTSKQFAYPLESASTGLSEILAWDNTRFLVLERDGESGKDARCKKIFLIDISKATDVSKFDSIGPQSLPIGVEPVEKELLIDLLNPEYGFHGEKAQEKPEGMTWGPNLEDGRKTLWVCYDNDFEVERPNLFLVFAVPSSF